jgi:hypothetical protein
MFPGRWAVRLSRGSRQSRPLHYVSLNFIEAIVYYAFLGVCTALQIRSGERPWASFTDIATYILFFHVCSGSAHDSFGRFWLSAWLLFETISWVATGKGVCSQTIAAIKDVRYTWVFHKEFFVAVAVLIVMVGFLAALRAPQRFRVVLIIPSFVLHLFCLLLSYTFYRTIRHSMNPYELQYNRRPTSPTLKDFFTVKDIHVTAPPHKKSLVLIHLECLELRSLGAFNPVRPEFMPFLSSLAVNSTVLENAPMESDQSFTIAAILAIHAGLPIIGPSYRNMGRVILSSKTIALTDFLEQLGYKQFASCPSYCSPYKFYRLHGVTTLDVFTHHMKTDWPHLQWVADHLVPDLLSKDDPFFLAIHTEGTHPMYHLDEECVAADAMLKSMPVGIAVIHCADMMLKRFFEKLDALNISERAEVIVYGDHLLWGQHDYYPRPRKLLGILPYHRRGMITKNVSWYGCGPTIMELLNVTEYSPRFPFGADIFGPIQGPRPSMDDRAYINELSNA